MTNNKPTPIGTLPKILFLIAIILFFGVSTLSRFVVDYKWFGSIGYPQVFVVTFTTKLLLFVIGFLVCISVLFFVWNRFKKIILATTATFTPIWATWEQVPKEYIDVTPETPTKTVIESIKTQIGIAFLIISLFAGLNLSSKWSTVLLYFNKSPFGSTDPVFGKDIGFYVFSLPFFHAVLNYLLGLFVLLSLLLILAYLSFNWQLVTKRVPLNLRLPLMFVFLLLAVKAYLLRFSILYSTTGVVYGAGYVDVNINQYIPLIISLVFLAAGITIAVLPLISSKGLSTKMPIAAVVLIIAISFIGGGAAWFVQEFKVSPNEIVLEEPFIEYNIDLTNRAYGLTDIKEQVYPISYNLTTDDIIDSPTINNVRLWDHQPLLTTFRQRQEIRTYYSFDDVVVDRYHINGELTQVWMSLREMNPGKLQGAADTWINKHLIYTHGIGVVLAPVNDVDDQGLPMMIIKDIPPKVETTDMVITQPRIYYGKQTNYYIITNTNREEFDYPEGDQNKYTTYHGTGGIPLTATNKLFLSLALGEIKLYTSEYITENSKLHLYRNINERVEKVTPYLLFDSVPHAFVSDDGRIYWMLSGFTTSDRYPYAEPTQFKGKRFNYISDSVKAVIDTYNGTTTYYIIKDDPILKAYAKIYPEIFKPLDAMPEDVKAHLRYSEDLFNIQTRIYTTYHMKTPEVFYNKEDLWEIPTEKYEASVVRVQPYNVLFQLNGELSFVTMMPFTPVNRDNMISWMAVKQDLPDYGEITVFKFTKEEQIYGPSQIEARIDQDEDISKDLTLWGQSGSRVIRGNLLVIPFKNSILYIEPLYLAAETGSIPELKRVIVFYNNSVAMERTLEQALNKVLGYKKIAIPAEISVSEYTGMNELLEQTIQHYEIATDALKDQDLETYGREMKTVDKLLQELKKQIEED